MYTKYISAVIWQLNHQLVGQTSSWKLRVLQCDTSQLNNWNQVGAVRCRPSPAALAAQKERERELATHRINMTWWRRLSRTTGARGTGQVLWCRCLCYWKSRTQTGVFKNPRKFWGLAPRKGFGSFKNLFNDFLFLLHINFMLWRTVRRF